MRHLVPAEVEVGGVGLDHGGGAVERTHLLVVAAICRGGEDLLGYHCYFTHALLSMERGGKEVSSFL